jgi:hypothetical protein
VLSSISGASQASNNLINALKVHIFAEHRVQLFYLYVPRQLVNREKESIETNSRVQECLAETKAARKAIIRYIQVSPRVADVLFMIIYVAGNSSWTMRISLEH